ncbi:MAG: type VI secretion system tip protein VgrG [Burkholderia sp.]|jgi:type VI secretion system VgrG family protein|uniref:type VI secretion system Vgr family protein n=1 Tax=Burkholderia sp. TaxID=36773 RepID=UPI00282AD868|nr:type VI secretion system tip protein TssI/VgrG [Burkholderia sp.]MDR0243994.1 type VI secretion system tip protein VgrG [Burkholderia sp.]
MATNKDILQALLGGWTQHERFLQLTTPLGKDALAAERLDGWEAIDGGGFRFEITALSDNPALPIARLVGGPVLVEWLTAEGGSQRRPFHAHVAAAELVGYNAGLARIRLVLEPWLAMLRQRVDSYNFNDASVIDISEQVFGYYTRGAVVPAWRWELADRERYPRRSLTVQAGESDFDFLSRLWAEEGLYYWFEHTSDAGATNLGSHTLVLADSNDRMLPREPERVPFHQAGESDPAGAIRHFALARRWRIGRVSRASWDYRTLSARPAAAHAGGAVVPGEDRDVAGPYAYQTAAVGDRRSQQQLDAQRVDAATGEGDGTRRDLRPGLRFSVGDHPTLGASDAFICLRVRHHARANVAAEIRSAIEVQLGRIPVMRDTDDGDLDSARHGGVSGEDMSTGDDAVYRNGFLAIPADRTYRPLLEHGHGGRSHAVAIAQGAQSAIVVGSGDPVHTERDHRIRIQHHAQRGENAASREAHPHAANAPANRGAGTWTRVVTPVGGANWGGVTIPRVGQEVWTELLEGQPDRPVAVAALYNGQGKVDAQHNARVGGPSRSTGNAAAWFAGNDHPAALTGFKTQDLGQSQTGTGGYRQFLLDDTAGQSRAHLYTTDRSSGLTLGHIKHQQDNRRIADRGYGVELATEAAGALRGGAGLLITTATGANQMDARAPGLDLAEGMQRVRDLVEAAQSQGAGVGASGQELPPDQLPAVAGLKQSRDALEATRSGGVATNGVGGGGGSAVAWSHPHLVAHGVDGIAAVSARSHVWVSGKETVLSAGQDLQVTAEGKTSVIANHGMSLYTQGNEGSGRTVDGRGIALHAASGAVSLQAQSGGTLAATAQRAVTLASVDAGATLQAKQRLLLTAADAFLKMEGGNIVVGGPGKVEFKASSHVLTGPQSASGDAMLARSQAKDCPQTMGDMIASSAACADL